MFRPRKDKLLSGLKELKQNSSNLKKEEMWRFYMDSTLGPGIPRKCMQDVFNIYAKVIAKKSLKTACQLLFGWRNQGETNSCFQCQSNTSCQLLTARCDKGETISCQKRNQSETSCQLLPARCNQNYFCFHNQN